MRLALVAAFTVLLLSGCTSSPTPSVPPTHASDTSPVTEPTPVSVPTRLAHEVSRDVYTGFAYDGIIHDVPRGTTELDLHVSCAGPRGTTMRWQVQDGHGNEYSAGTATCNGQEQIEADQSGHFPKAPVVHLDAPAAVLNGYAILTGR